MELGPLNLLIIRLLSSCPMPTKNRMGTNQLSRKDRTGDICSWISLENSAPDALSRLTKSGSVMRPVL